MWAISRLSRFVLRTGLIKSILAPVVPNILAIIPPKTRKRVLFRGVASISPLKNIPPEITKREASKIIKEKYSFIS
jgi:hypothetical protein